MLYNENMVFGVEALDIKTAGSASIYAGQVNGGKASAGDAKAIDIGKATGVYKDQYYARIECVEEVEGTANVKFKFHFLEAEDSADTKSSVELIVPASALNEAKRTPLEVSLPSIAGRYCRLEVSADASLTKGVVIVAIEPTRW